MNRYFNVGKKGHHDKEDHKKSYHEEDGHKKKHHDEGWLTCDFVIEHEFYITFFQFVGGYHHEKKKGEKGEKGELLPTLIDVLGKY